MTKTDTDHEFDSIKEYDKLDGLDVYKPRRKYVIAVTTVVAVIIAAVVAAAYVLHDSNGDSQPAHISNTLKPAAGTVTDGTAKQEPDKTQGTAKPAAAGTVDACINDIAIAVSKFIGDEWSEYNYGQMRDTLKQCNVTVNAASFNGYDGKPIYKYSTIGHVQAGWLKTGKLKTDKQNDGSYMLNGEGDFGFINTPKDPNLDSASYVKQIHHIFNTQVHGADGSERSLRPFKFKVTVSSDRKTGELQLLDGANYSDASAQW